MNSEVHMPIGVATSLGFSLVIPAMNPESVIGLVGGVGLAVVGSVIPDIDCDGDSKTKKEFRKMLPFAIGGIFVSMMSNTGQEHASSIGGLLIFLACCIYGYFQAHRTFTHRIIGLVLFTFGVYLALGERGAMWFGFAMLSHQIADMCNKKKIMWLYPISRHDFSKYWFKADSPQAKACGILASILIVVFGFLRLSMGLE